MRRVETAAHRRTLSAAQVRICQTARRMLALADDDYRAILRRCGGVESTTKLSQHGLSQVLAEFERLGWRNTSAGKPFSADHRPGRASAAQVALVRRLWLDWTDGEGSDATLGVWLGRHQGWGGGSALAERQ